MSKIINLTRFAKRNEVPACVTNFLNAIKENDADENDVEIFYNIKFDWYIAKGNLMLIFDSDVRAKWFFDDIDSFEFYDDDCGNYYLYDTSDYGICEGYDKPYENIIEVDGHSYSRDWLKESDDYFLCEHCNEWHKTDEENTVYVDGYEEYWCDDCTNEDATCCEDCGRYFHNDDVISVNDGSYYVCNRCRRNGDYYECYECGNIYDYDHFEEGDDGEYYCESCINNHQSQIVHTYHNGPDFVFHTSYKDEDDYGECKKYIGTEVETEKGDYEERKDFTYEFGEEEEYIYQMKDGSLDSDGIECITMPMSYNFWKEYDFEGWMQGLVERGARAHDTENCGLHVHLSREWINDGGKYDEYQLAIVGRIRQFISDNAEVIKRFARRGEERWCAYSKPFSDKKELEGLSTDEVNKKFAEKANDVTDRYQALNNKNSKTIEFRIFKGTLNPETYRASVEFCLRLVDYIKSHCDVTVSWEDFLSYKPLPDSMYSYMKRRNIIIPVE